jgi:DNA-binding NtrC family response regulator
VDVRVIAASNRDLYQEASEGRFREHLFWRLNVVPIHLPPLRRRREDIPPLVHHFLKHFSQVNGRRVTSVSDEAMAALVNYGWPGNVRELQNYIERAVVLAEGEELSIEWLPTSVSGQGKTELRAFRGSDAESLIEEFVTNELAAAGDDAGDLQARIVNPVERELIVQVLRQCHQVQKKAADRLGINRNTLHKKMKEHGIE